MTKGLIASRRLHNSAAGLAFFIAAWTLSLSSCTSPAAVAGFADIAQKDLAQGPMIFHDIHDSCVRRHLDAQPITPLFLAGIGKTGAGASPPAENPVCTPFTAQAEALTKASGVLTAYFRAMQQLAAFNTSSVSGPGAQAAQNAAYAAQLSFVQADSAGKLAGIILQAFTARYQRSHLTKYLRDADPSISSVTQGFEDISSKDYEGLLHEEQQTLTAEYQKVGDARNSATVLLLNQAYADALAELNRRKAVADAYAEALEQIREGHKKLAENADHLTGEKMSVAIQPYTTKLQALLPVLEKGF